MASPKTLAQADPLRRSFIINWSGDGSAVGAQNKKTGLSSCLFILAEMERFELSIPFWGIHDFQSCALDQLRDISMCVRPYWTGGCRYLTAKIIIAGFPCKVKPCFRIFLIGPQSCPAGELRRDRKGKIYLARSSSIILSTRIRLRGRWKGPLKVLPLVEGMVGRPSRRR